jgi:hypothetical protein
LGPGGLIHEPVRAITPAERTEAATTVMLGGGLLIGIAVFLPWVTLRLSKINYPAAGIRIGLGQILGTWPCRS